MSANNIGKVQDLITNVTLLVEVGRLFSSHTGMPGRTLVEIRQELLRLQVRLHKQKPRNEKEREDLAKHPKTWEESSEDSDDVYTPRSKARSDSFAKGNRAATSKGKTAEHADVDSDDEFTPRSKARSDALTKGKSKSPADVDSDDDFMPSSKGKRAASAKGKRAASAKGKRKGV
jgi:hypothetical protein